MRRLVNTLLVVLIIGVVAIVMALVLKLKETPIYGFAERKPSERIVEADATADRVTLLLRDAETGAERVIVLDGRTFLPVGEITAGAEAPMSEGGSGAE